MQNDEAMVGFIILQFLYLMINPTKGCIICIARQFAQFSFLLRDTKHSSNATRFRLDEVRSGT
jgi:hypothetical protein